MGRQDQPVGQWTQLRLSRRRARAGAHVRAAPGGRRACRLVADTGIHWKGWSLDQARECFTKNSALSPLNIEVELARYVSWPGQALAYKTGEMKIVAIREKARAELGEAFDIRRFHDAVLQDGPMPLDMLERKIDAWTAAEKAGS